MRNPHTTSSVAIIALINLLKDKNWSFDKIEQKTGILCSKLNDPDARISMKKFLLLWDLGVDVSRDPALGLHLRNHYGKTLKHFVVTLAMKSSNSKIALNNWIRYQQLVSDTDCLEQQPDDKYLRIAYYNKNPELENRYLPEHHLSLALSYYQQYMKRKVYPFEVHFRHADPGYSDEYYKVFRCPVFFGQNENLIIGENKQVSCFQTEDDQYLQAILIKHAEEKLQSLSSPETFKGRVQDFLLKNLAQGTGDIQNAATFLNMDRTTLHRHLQRENTSFSEILVETRQQLAHNYLEQNFSLSEISSFLGFSDPCGFQRAFKRWFGVPPGQYKKALEQSRTCVGV